MADQVSIDNCLYDLRTRIFWLKQKKNHWHTDDITPQVIADKLIDNIFHFTYQSIYEKLYPIHEDIDLIDIESFPEEEKFNVEG
mgnify:CR=1 FL=1